MHSVSSSSSKGICLGGAAVGGLNLNLSCLLTGIPSSYLTSSWKVLTGTLGGAKLSLSLSLSCLCTLIFYILALRSLKDPAKYALRSFILDARCYLLFCLNLIASTMYSFVDC